MFGHRYFGLRFYGPRYFADGGTGTPPPTPPAGTARGGMVMNVGGLMTR
jgi:hypothetical protein